MNPDEICCCGHSFEIHFDGNCSNVRCSCQQFLWIEAAPELLETVIAYRLHHKLLLNVIDDTDCPCKICQLAEAAIRKAKGE